MMRPFYYIILLLLWAQQASSQQSRPPNIIVILTDDQTYRAIGYENKLVQTPHLDQLARKGIIFREAFTATPICVASRASLLTGRYPQQHKAIALGTSAFIDTIVVGKKYKTLPRYLLEAGYKTLFCGKSHLGPPVDYGFSRGKESKDIKDSVTFLEASAFVRDDSIGQSPFFLWIGARQPHLPLLPDQQWLDRYAKTDIQVDPNFLEKPPEESFFNQGLPGEHYFRDADQVNNYLRLPAGPPRTAAVMRSFIKAYYATISHLDEQVGILIDQLRQKKLLDNTVIFFLSDNGYFLGNHGLGNKITMHEESVHIPFFIYPPSAKIKPFKYEGLVSTLDIFPTILDLAGISPPDNLPGRSLVSVINGDTNPVHQVVISECTGVGGLPGMGHRMVRSDKWKYILSDTGQEALFDLVNDPYELHNVYDQKKYQGILRGFRKDLHSWTLQVL
jgi:arylsulfatase A-like enzyme